MLRVSHVGIPGYARLYSLQGLAIQAFLLTADMQRQVLWRADDITHSDFTPMMVGTYSHTI